MKIIKFKQFAFAYIEESQIFDYDSSLYLSKKLVSRLTIYLYKNAALEKMKKNFLNIAKQLLKCLLIAAVAIVVLKRYFESQLKLKHDLIERQYVSSIDDLQVKLVIEPELNRSEPFQYAHSYRLI